MRTAALGLAAALAAATLPAGARAATVDPYRQDDYADGGALNILPPGQNGLVTLLHVLQGQTPPHFDDQRAGYDDLVYTLPGWDDLGVPYFKDASFGVPPEKVEREYSPRPGVTVQRDSDYGVPHIYGDTTEDVAFGAGYVSAEDRLFLMDVLRHAGRGRLSEFLGPDPAFIASDRAQIAITGYDEAELQQQLDRLPQEFGAVGQLSLDALEAYSDGVSTYVQEALVDQSKRPVEYSAASKGPEPWLPTDSVAVASLIGAIFGGGGGGEVRNAELLQRLQDRFGSRIGRRVFRDLRQAQNPEAPVTAPGTFPYPATGPVDPEAIALPDLEGPGRRGPATPTAAVRRGLARAGLPLPEAASNAIALGAEGSATGHPIFVAGPQVGYSLPQLLLELDLHGPDVDSRGAAFPGVSVAVLLGRGQDFAWSATSAGADLTDVRVERLCESDGSPPTAESTHYLFEGQCTEMFRRTDTWTANPPPGEPGEPQQVTVEIQRTVHGPVTGRGTVDGDPVAFAVQRSTWFREVDSVRGFVMLNSPSMVDDAESFSQAVDGIDFTFNWFYADDRDIAYHMSCLCPRRAEGVNPDLPSWGTGEWEWEGFIPFEEHPQVINPAQGWLTSWNNKPAAGFRASDENYAYGSVHRVEMLDDRIRARLEDGPLTATGVVELMEDAGTTDLRGQEVLPLLLRVLSDGGGGDVRRAARELRRWLRDEAMRRDRDRDGAYEHGPAVAIMDAWWPRLVRTIYDELRGLFGLVPMPFDDAANPGGSAYFSGYYGYVDRDLRHALGRALPRRPALAYCGALAACRRALARSLDAALEALGDRFGPDMADWRPDPVVEAIRFESLSALAVDPMHWVNRPTFQQVVSFPAHRPRG